MSGPEGAGTSRAVAEGHAGGEQASVAGDCVAWASAAAASPSVREVSAVINAELGIDMDELDW